MKTQFSVLYREFLFRIVDPELLAGDAHGDSNTLLGQFAALLVFLSLIPAMTAFAFMRGNKASLVHLVGSMVMEHFLIATTMLAVGLFAVLSWDSTFPDRRDVMVLSPLPVRARTLFLAKSVASLTGLSLAVGVFNGLAGLLWPFALWPDSGFLGLLRSIAAYWGTMFAAGLFVYLSVLCLQGFSAQLFSRRTFLRVSGLMQIVAFCLFVSVYFLQPPFEGLSELVDPKTQRLFSWLPSYWFLGLLQQLNGTLVPALAPLATRAWIGLGVAFSGTAVAFLLSWFRALRKIAEEAEITAGARGGMWLPPFGNGVRTAIVQFSIRTLMRSRRHRLILAFYAGIGFALVIFMMKAPDADGHAFGGFGKLFGADRRPAMIAATLVMLGAWVVGVRIGFAMPLDLRANWVFRIAPIRGAAECLKASRRSLLALGFFPLWTALAILLFSVWPWREALEHLAVLILFGLILIDVCLHNFRKIPYSCSYLPGRSNVHVTLWLAVLLILDLAVEAGRWELRILGNAPHYAEMIGVLILGAIVLRRLTAVRTWDDGPPVFEKVPPEGFISLEIGNAAPVPKAEGSF